MLNKSQLLGGSDGKLKEALNFLAFGLGKPHNITVLIGRVSDELWDCYEKQGGNLDEVNQLRSKHGLFKLNVATNIKIVKKSWGKNIINGRGAVFVIQKFAYRLSENKNIENAFEWLSKQFPDFKIDKVSNDKYDTFYIGYKFKEIKEEPVIEQVAPSDTNETAV